VIQLALGFKVLPGTWGTRKNMGNIEDWEDPYRLGSPFLYSLLGICIVMVLLDSYRDLEYG